MFRCRMTPFLPYIVYILYKGILVSPTELVYRVGVAVWLSSRTSRGYGGGLDFMEGYTMCQEIINRQKYLMSYTGPAAKN